jgi:hypothetical protein
LIVLIPSCQVIDVIHIKSFGGNKIHANFSNYFLIILNNPDPADRAPSLKLEIETLKFVNALWNSTVVPSPVGLGYSIANIHRHDLSVNSRAARSGETISIIQSPRPFVYTARDLAIELFIISYSASCFSGIHAISQQLGLLPIVIRCLICCKINR